MRVSEAPQRRSIHYIEYRQTENGEWISEKFHADCELVMEHKIADGEIAQIEAGERPDWTLLGLPEIRCNGEVIKEYLEH